MVGFHPDMAGATCWVEHLKVFRGHLIFSHSLPSPSICVTVQPAGDQNQGCLQRGEHTLYCNDKGAKRWMYVNTPTCTELVRTYIELD